MADPISGLGTAVGVASLGIQVCQSLYRYYSQFQDFDKDIDAILKRLVELENRLELLDSLRVEVDVSGSSVSLGLQRALDACDVGASDLQLMMQRCGSTKPPASSKEKARLLKSRILWPLRKNNVSDMGTTLDRLIHDVQFAVQILQIQIAQKSSQVQEANLVATATRIDQAQSTILQAIQSGMDNHPNIHLTSDEATKLGVMSQQMSLQLASVQHQLGQLIISSERRKDERLLEPAATSEIAKRLPKLRRTVPCTCHTRQSSPWFSKFGRLIRVEAFRKEEHHVDCDFHHTGDLAYTIQAQYQQYTQALNFCVQASISLARISGRYTVQPTLQVWAMKQIDSPAFAPFWNVRKMFGCSCEVYWQFEFYCRCGTPEEGPLVIQSIMVELRNSYKSGSASPYDILIDTKHTIIERAYGLCFEMVRHGHISTQTAREFLDLVIRVSGPRREQEQIWGLMSIANTASDYQMDTQTSEDMAEIWIHLISYLGTWTPEWPAACSDRTSLIAKLLRSRELLEMFDCACPLELALWQRSKQDLVRELHIHHRNRCNGPGHPAMYKVCWNEASMIGLAIHWTEGLELLLSSPIIQGITMGFDAEKRKNEDFCSGVSYAVQALNFDALRMLHQAGFPVYARAWFDACYYAWIWFRDSQEFRGMLKLLQHLAKAMYECTTIYDKASQESSRDCHVVTSYNNLYNTSNMTCRIAQYLWKVGFKLIDEASAGGTMMSYNYGTPLWIQASKSGRYNPIDWRLLKWYVDKGARLDWEHPERRTTPAHLIGYQSARRLRHRRYYWYSSRSRGARFVAKVLSYRHLDGCDCRCSTAGCLPIGCAVKEFFGLGMIDNLDQSWCQLLLKLICKVVDTEQALRLSTGLSVIRVLTFDELGLTHTCCKSLYRDQGWLDQGSLETWSEDAIRDVQHIESKDIALLEAMMVDFEQTWSEHSAGFDRFLKDIWIPRIKEHHARIASENQAEAIRRIESTGVILWEPFGPRPPQPYAEGPEDDGDEESDSEVGVAVVSEVDSESQPEDDSEESSDDDMEDDLDDLSEEGLVDTSGDGTDDSGDYLDSDSDGGSHCDSVGDSEDYSDEEPGSAEAQELRETETDSDLEDEWATATGYETDDGFF